jgi:hypothetical protein
MSETYPKIVKVRRMGRNNEAILHAPYDATGTYLLTVEKDGIIKYTPAQNQKAAEPAGKAGVQAPAEPKGGS